MAIPDSLLPSDIPYGKPWERKATPPKQDPTQERVVKEGEAPVEELEAEGAVSKLVKHGAKALGEQLGRNTEGSLALIAGEAFPVAFLRTILPADLLKRYLPKGMVKDVKDVSTPLGESMTIVADEGLRKLPKAFRPKVGGRGPDIGPAESGWGELAGTVGEFGGQGLGMPVAPGMKLLERGGSMAINASKAILGDLAFNAGVGTAAHGGGEMGEAVARMGGAGESGQEVGKGVGTFLGALGGSFRHHAVGEAVRQPYEKVVKPSVSRVSDVVNKRRGDQRTLETILEDDLKNLDAVALDAMEKRVATAVARDLRGSPTDPNRDIHNFPEAYKAFQEWGKRLGLSDDEISKFHLAQQTGSPSLVGTVRQMIPQTPEQTDLLVRGHKAPEKVLVDAVKRVTENGVKDADRFKKQLTLFATRENQKIQALNDAALVDVNSKISKELAAPDLMEQGRVIGKARTELHDSVKAKRDEFYNKALELDDQVHPEKFDIGKATQEVKEVLQTTLSQVDPGTVPESLRKLRTLFSQSKQQIDDVYKDLDLTQLSPDNRQWVLDQRSKQLPPSKPVSLRDINDVVVTLHDDMAAARSARDWQAYRNLEKVEKSLKTVIQEQAPPEVIEAFNDAVKFHRDTYVPMFREGYGLSIGREAPVSREGHSLVEDYNRINILLQKDAKAGMLSETMLGDFDNLFGGKLPGTKRVEEAYNELARGVESRFQRDLIKNNPVEGFKPEKYEAFLKEYEPALRRLPGLKEKFDTVAERIIDLQEQRKGIEERFKFLTGESPISAKFGPEDAQKIISHALSDPRKAGQLIALGGPEGAKSVLKEISYLYNPVTKQGGFETFDTRKLKSLLEAGKVGEEGIGGLQVMARVALGKAEGDAHIERLKALVNIGDRVEMTKPQFLSPREPVPTDPIGIPGNPMAGVLSMFKSWAEGRAGATYFGGMVGSRFANAQMKKRLNDAYLKILFDPKYSKAAVDIAQSTEALPKRSSLETLLGAGKGVKEFLDSLYKDPEMMRKQIMGLKTTIAVEANRGEEDQSSRTKRRTDRMLELKGE